MKKYFLTTALMGTFIAPVFGADKIITSANTCTVDVLGVSDNNAVANTIATWDLIDYTLNPGQYLNVTETSVDKTTCPAGSYCVGGGYTVETANNSIAQCPAEYPNSAEGAGAQNQCYTACTVANANIAHATAVSGNDYFGTGVDTCTPTGCEMGYHVESGGIEVIEKAPLVPVDYKEFGDTESIGYISADGKYTSGEIEYGLTENNTWAAKFSSGIVYGRASCRPATNNNKALMYISNHMDDINEISDFEVGLATISGEAKAKYFADLYRGALEGSMSETDFFAALAALFTIEKDADYSTTDTGTTCYCQMDGFAPTGGDKVKVASAYWVNNFDFSVVGEDESVCANACASYCAMIPLMEQTDYFVQGDAYRGALFGVFDMVESGGICAANTINIDWNPDNGGEHTVNQCTYEGTVTLPTPDPVKPGYTFTGWKLVE